MPKQIQTCYQNLFAEIADEPVPRRRNCLNPRVIKRGRCKWPGKKLIHYGLSKLQKTFVESILIH